MYISVDADEPALLLGNPDRPDSPGDFLERLIITVTNSADCVVQVHDGDPAGNGETFTLMPDNPGSGIGVYPVVTNMQSRIGKFRITTNGGSACIAVGTFL